MPMVRFIRVLILLYQQVTHKNNLRRKTCLINVTDVNMTSKRAFLQKVTCFTIQRPEKGVLAE